MAAAGLLGPNLVALAAAATREMGPNAKVKVVTVRPPAPMPKFILKLGRDRRTNITRTLPRQTTDRNQNSASHVEWMDLAMQWRKSAKRSCQLSSGLRAWADGRAREGEREGGTREHAQKAGRNEAF